MNTMKPPASTTCVTLDPVGFVLVHTDIDLIHLADPLQDLVRRDNPAQGGLDDHFGLFGSLCSGSRLLGRSSGLLGRSSSLLRRSGRLFCRSSSLHGSLGNGLRSSFYSLLFSFFFHSCFLISHGFGSFLSVRSTNTTTDCCFVQPAAVFAVLRTGSFRTDIHAILPDTAGQAVKNRLPASYTWQPVSI